MCFRPFSFVNRCNNVAYVNALKSVAINNVVKAQQKAQKRLLTAAALFNLIPKYLYLPDMSGSMHQLLNSSHVCNI